MGQIFCRDPFSMIFGFTFLCRNFAFKNLERDFESSDNMSEFGQLLVQSRMVTDQTLDVVAIIDKVVMLAVNFQHVAWEVPKTRPSDAGGIAHHQKLAAFFDDQGHFRSLFETFNSFQNRNDLLQSLLCGSTK